MTKPNSKIDFLPRIGTSNIALPGPKHTFPEEYQTGTRLQYYSVLFNTLEVNSTFYKIPKFSTLEKWAAEVSDTFNFTLKLWRGITHSKNLIYKKEDIDVFMQAASHLGKRRACLLVQFPASITFAYLKEVGNILLQLHQLNKSANWNIVVEFRHKSWYVDNTYALLHKYNASIVFHDIAASKPPIAQPANKVIYYRFHGPAGDYRGSYTEAFLEEYAAIFRAWLQKGKQVYVYFNNTLGNAFQNAQLLKELI